VEEGLKHYLDVKVFVSSGKSEGEYSVRVDCIEAGVAPAYSITLPFALQDLHGLVAGSSGDAARGLPLRGDRRSGPPVRNFGADLYEALFTGRGRDILHKALGHAGALQDTGVRLRLSMDLGGAGMVNVALLPWELLTPRDEQPLVISDKTPLVRSLDALHPSALRPFGGTLRILVVMSNPTGTPQLDLAIEQAKITQSWAGINVAVDFARPVREAFRDQLRGADYHVVHFMGHGEFDQHHGGVLLFEKGDDRSPDPVSGEQFAAMLKQEPLRLVYLNACKTATTADGSAPGALHPFAGVASALIKDIGVPAVVAMQFPISDRAAISFATTFYKCIAEQHPVEVCVAQARNALYTDGISEWVTPVLYLRTPNGMLFAAPPSAPSLEPVLSAAAASPDPASATPDSPLIFLAAPCEKLKGEHRQLARELTALGMRVIDDVPEPHDTPSHTARVRALVTEADLSVHLMGDTAGEPMEEQLRKPENEKDALRTYPIEQLRIGLDHARAQLIVIPDLETIAEPEYKEYLTSISTRAYPPSKELAVTGKLEVKAAVLAHLERQKDLASAAPSVLVESAFVDAHALDTGVADELVRFLRERNVQTYCQTGQAPVVGEQLTRFGEKVRQYPLYVLVTGKADANWVLERETVARRSTVKVTSPILLTKYDGRDPGPITLSRLTIDTARNCEEPNPKESMFRAADGGQP